MKIAVDCQGTLLSDQYKGPLLNFIEEAVAHGHQVVIWSNASSYISEAIRILNVAQVKGREKVTTSKKHSQTDAKEQGLEWVDLAIDDDTGISYLAAKRLIHPAHIKDVSL